MAQQRSSAIAGTLTEILDARVKRDVVLPKDRPELFYIPNETLYAISEEECEATYSDMEQMGLAHLPYPVVDIGVSGDLIMRLEERHHPDQMVTKSMKVALPFPHDEGVPGSSPSDMNSLREAVEKYGEPFKDFELRFRYEDEKPILCMLRNPKNAYFDIGRLSNSKSANAAAIGLRKILIVLLATKNAVKTRTRDKLLSMGIGAKKNSFRPLYTTTITLPESLQPAKHGGHSGVEMRPHLRRGHIRRQRFGPKLTFSKPIWIEPCFINADEEFVSSRRAYNLGVSAGGPPT